MPQSKRKPLVAHLTRALVIGLLVAAPFVALAIGTRNLQRSFCPADTFVSGHLEGLLVMVGMVGLWVAGILLLGKKGVRRFGVLIAIPAALAWADGLGSYYCATPKAIVVHPDPLTKPVKYSWSDVARLEVGCVPGKSVSAVFDLHLKDGRRLSLGGDSWPMTLEHYDGVIAALAHTSYAYDKQRLIGCPPEYRNRFDKKPG
jgi:hypothetical protein